MLDAKSFDSAKNLMIGEKIQKNLLFEFHQIKYFKLYKQYVHLIAHICFVRNKKKIC